jgi:hypothetical protein
MLGRTSSVGQGNERFTARRRKRQRRIAIASILLLLFVIGGTIYALRQSAVRISRVQIFGADQSLSEVALTAMRGSYLGLIPRDSTFFYPARAIRSRIMEPHPDIAAISFFRSGLTGLSIRISERVPIARWCGLAPTDFASDSAGHGSDEYCYVFDASGFVFGAYATSSEPINAFKLYDPLAGDTGEPLRATLTHAEQLPGAFDFARQLATFGSPVTAIVVRGDEVDDLLASGTRVTYVLGSEQNAFTALVSAKKTLDLADGSVEYVDLRFNGKVYLKNKGEAPK